MKGFVIIGEPETPPSEDLPRPCPYQPSYLAFRVWDNKGYIFKPSDFESLADSRIRYISFSKNSFILG